MKINKFLVTALVATMTLASCSKEATNNGGNGGQGDASDTYAGISVVLPAGGMEDMTRAEDVNTGIPAEKALQTIGIYIVDVDSGGFDYEVLDVNATNFAESTEAGTNRPIRTAKVAVKTVTGKKKVFVVANGVQSAAGTSTLQTKIVNVRGAALNAAGLGLPTSDFLFYTGGTTLGNMVISGVSAQVTLNVQTNSAGDANGALNAANLISVSIERNLAKIVMQEATAYNVTGGTSTLTWALGGMAKDAFFLPQTTSTSLYQTVPAAAIGDATHAYWSNFSGTTSASLLPADYIQVIAKGADANQATAAQSKYCFENFRTSGIHTGNTTTAIVKGVFVPSEVYYVSGGVITKGTNANLPANGDFYVSKIDGNYYTNDARTLAATNNYNGHTNAVTDFDYYAGGVGYYTIHVQDEAKVVGTKRNSYYLLQINEVRGPGRPTIVTPPITELEKDTYIGVTVTVKHWDFQKSGHDLQ